LVQSAETDYWKNRRNQGFWHIDMTKSLGLFWEKAAVDGKAV